MNTALLVSNMILCLLLAGLSFTVVALARQIGLLHERIAPAGALMVSGRPKVGEAVPVLEITDIKNNDLSVGAPRDDSISTLIFFLSPNCPVCKTLLSALKSSKKSERDWLDIMLASDRETAAQEAFINHFDLGSFTYILSSTLR